jgi:predicted aspartyl protease
MRFVFDSDNRPLALLRINGKEQAFLIDTGFNSSLAIGMDAAHDLHISPSGPTYYSDTAGSPASFRFALAQVEWFGSLREVEVCVWKANSIGPVDGLIGVRFLIGYILTIDFNEGTVSVVDPAYTEG